MDNKQLWTTVIVAAVVAVLASLVTAGIMQNVALAPRGNTVNSGGGSSIINAHACSADETCEVNKLRVSSQDNEEGINIDTSPSGELGGSITSDGVLKIISNANNLPNVPSVVLVSGILSVYEPDFLEKGSLLMAGNAITSTSGALNLGGDIRLTSLYGNENSYLCINSEEQIYRSQTPCVQ